MFVLLLFNECAKWEVGGEEGDVEVGGEDEVDG